MLLKQDTNVGFSLRFSYFSILCKSSMNNCHWLLDDFRSICFQEKMFWKQAANFQESSHVKKWFQYSRKAALLKLYFGISLLLLICCLLLEHLFLTTALEGCFYDLPVFDREAFLYSLPELNKLERKEGQKFLWEKCIRKVVFKQNCKLHRHSWQRYFKQIVC